MIFYEKSKDDWDLNSIGGGAIKVATKSPVHSNGF
jgi:hypothetical protein